MHITVLGSTGRTGTLIVQQACRQGHTVRALARSPEKMTVEHPCLQVVTYDALQSDPHAAVDHTDAVIIALGGAVLNDHTTRSVGTQRILNAMQQNGPKRLLIVSSAGAGESYNQLSDQGRMVVDKVIKVAVEDHERQEAAVIDSQLDWTIVRPGGLTQDPFASYVADDSGQMDITSISRASVADFLLRSVFDPKTISKIYTLHVA